MVERRSEFLRAVLKPGCLAILFVTLLLSPLLVVAASFAGEYFGVFAGHLVPTCVLLALGTYGPAIILGGVLGLCFTQRGEGGTFGQRATPVDAAFSGLGAGLVGGLVILPVVIGGLWLIANSVLDLFESVVPGARQGVEAVLGVVESLLVSLGFEFSFTSLLFVVVLYAALQGLVTGLFAGLTMLTAPQEELSEERKSWSGALGAIFACAAGFHLMIETESFFVVLPCLIVLPFLMRPAMPMHVGMSVAFLAALVAFFVVNGAFSFWLIGRPILAGCMAQMAAASILRSTARRTAGSGGEVLTQPDLSRSPVALDGAQ
ncbi:MAG: hypothetical protein H6833_07520 [Planctomycetes bacterium]|nr:hypothetical protein [Planctomycetota bacterium]